VQDEYEEINNEEDVEDIYVSEVDFIKITEDNINVLNGEIIEKSIEINSNIYTFKRNENVPIENDFVVYDIYKNGKILNDHLQLNLMYLLTKDTLYEDTYGNILVMEDNVSFEFLRSFLMSYVKIYHYEETNKYLDTMDNAISIDFISQNETNFARITTENKEIDLNYSINTGDKKIVLTKLNMEE
jgi:hypothetical protein